MKTLMAKLVSALGTKLSIGSLSVSMGTILATTATILAVGGTATGIVVSYNAQNAEQKQVEATATAQVQESSDGEDVEAMNQNGDDSIPDVSDQGDTSNTPDSSDVETEKVLKEAHYHSLNTEIVKESTCLVAGSAIDTCEECGYSNTYTLPLKAHSGTNWIVEKGATETAEGLQTLHCDDCNTLLSTEVIAIIPHNHNYVTIDTKGATCRENGYTKHTCTICDSSYSNEVPAIGHNYQEQIVEDATCTKEGYVYRKCSTCGDISKVGTIEKLNHEYSDWKVSTVATCTTNGAEERTCAVCGKTETKEVVATGHVKEDSLVTIVKEPTCTEKGELEYQCSSCEETIREEMKALGHKETDWIVDLNPTCTTAGSKHVECSVCGEILSTELIGALGHDLELVGMVDSTCSAEGVEHYACKECTYEEDKAISLKGHDSSDWIVTISETCLTNGAKHKECLNCHAKLEDETIPATGHKYGDVVVLRPTCTEEGTSTITCSTCGNKEITKIEATGHSFRFVQRVNPTCSAVGFDIYVCNNGCSASEFRNEVPSYDCSDYASDWIVDTDSTCMVEGSKHKECTKCGTELETSTILKKPHVFENYVVTVPATEDAEGSEIATCNHCDTTDTKAIGKLPHVHDYATEINRTEATCTEDGFYTVECKCEATLKVDLLKTGHDYALTTHTDENCIADGEDIYTCSKCNDSYSDIILAHGHTSGEWEVVTEATDLLDGEKVRKCTDCNTTLETQIISKLPHTCAFDTFLESQDATCTTDGFEKYQCKCELTETIVLPKTNHVNHGWVTITDATYTEMGLKQDVCTDCNYVLNSENIPVVPHTCNYVVAESVNPTCTEGGHTTSTCDICGKTKTENLNAKGHTETSFITDSNATCTEDGSRHTQCATCNITLKTEVIPATGHNVSEFSTETSPTCTTAGLEKKSCSLCDYSETRSIPATGHNYGDWIIDKEATEEEEGEQHKECANCDDVITEDTPLLPPHVHSYGENSRVDATCTTVGKITYTCECGESYSEELNKSAHTAGDFITDSTPTCTTVGSKHKECTSCGVTTETETIPATGHKYGDAVVVNATCNADGSSVITCLTCGNSEKTVIKKTEHNYVEKTKVNATCETAGSISYECLNCNDTYSKTITKLSHEYSVTSNILATCTNGGYDIETCKHCGDTKKINESSALGHKEGEATVITEAKLGEAGLKEVHCENCNLILSSEEIPMLLTDGVDSVYYFDIINEDGTYGKEMAIGHYSEEDEQEMFEIFNNYRTSIGLSTLINTNDYVNDYTDLRARETSYLWDHKRPAKYGTKYAENIAISYYYASLGGNVPPEDIFKAWLGSPGHKGNIEANRTYGLTGLSVFYKRVPVENWKTTPYVYTGYWVQTFY